MTYLNAGMSWEFNGHTITVDEDYEPEENCKIMVDIIRPDGTRAPGDLTPYGTTKELVELYILAGFPPRPWFGNCSLPWSYDILSKAYPTLVPKEVAQ